MKLFKEAKLKLSTENNVLFMLLKPDTIVIKNICISQLENIIFLFSYKNNICDLFVIIFRRYQKIK